MAMLLASNPFWTLDCIETFLSAVPNDRMIVVDVNSVTNPAWLTFLRSLAKPSVFTILSLMSTNSSLKFRQDLCKHDLKGTQNTCIHIAPGTRTHACAYAHGCTPEHTYTHIHKHTHKIWILNSNHYTCTIHASPMLAHTHANMHPHIQLQYVTHFNCSSNLQECISCIKETTFS